MNSTSKKTETKAGKPITVKCKEVVYLWQWALPPKIGLLKASQKTRTSSPIQYAIHKRFNEINMTVTLFHNRLQKEVVQHQSLHSYSPVQNRLTTTYACTVENRVLIGLVSTLTVNHSLSNQIVDYQLQILGTQPHDTSVMRRTIVACNYQLSS